METSAMLRPRRLAAAAVALAPVMLTGAAASSAQSLPVGVACPPTVMPSGATSVPPPGYYGGAVML
jgi:hypothetical protein